MRRQRLHAACALLLLGSAARAAPGEPARAPQKAAAERAGATPVIACPSLANLRALLNDGESAAAAILADPKADHLGCLPLARSRITGVVDRVVLGGRPYDCAGVQGTAACHWVEGEATPASR